MDSVQTEANSVVALREQPCPGVARAMIGPILPPDNETGSTTRCLAVSNDGSIASCWEIDVRSFYERPSIFWDHAALTLGEAKLQPLSSFDSGARLNPPDCVNVLRSSSFWLPRPSTSDLHPAVSALSNHFAVQHFGTAELNFEEKLATDLRAQADAESAITSGVFWVLHALRPDILSVIRERPGISISLCHALLRVAEKYGEKAVVYSLQALATEAIGCLNLIARGQPEDEARILREALFTGTSLPSAFSEIGVPKSAHRRSLQPKPLVFRDLDLVPDPPRGINDLPLSGSTFLAALRLQRFIPVHGRQDFVEFSLFVEKFSLLGLRDPSGALSEKLFQWCLASGRYIGSANQLHSLMERAQVMVIVTRNLAHQEITIETAVNKILEAKKGDSDTEGEGGFSLTESSSRSFGQVLRFLSTVSGKNVDYLMHPIFNAHPGLPNSVTALALEFSIAPLDGFTAVLAHGATCDNCLKVPAGIKPYLEKRLALFAVRAGDAAIGTIALGLNGMDAVQVLEVRGHANANASTHLVGVAEDLARSFVRTEDLSRWMVYEERCKDWFRAYSA